jgi:hypothetical protein
VVNEGSYGCLHLLLNFQLPDWPGAPTGGQGRKSIPAGLKVIVVARDAKVVTRR